VLPVARGLLVAGENVLTCEIHNATATGGDAYFDAAFALRGRGYAPGIELTSGGVRAVDHGGAASFSAGESLVAEADLGVASAWAPVRLVLALDGAPSGGFHAAATNWLTLAEGVADAAGAIAFSLGAAPASLIGASFRLQALSAGASSPALRATIAP
jgi:hypothetical protein